MTPLSKNKQRGDVPICTRQLISRNSIQEKRDRHSIPFFVSFPPFCPYKITETVYVTDVEADAWDVGFRDELTWEAWVAAAIDRSIFTSDVRPAASEKILTLSTCSYEFSNARFVLLGVLCDICSQ